MLLYVRESLNRPLVSEWALWRGETGECHLHQVPRPFSINSTPMSSIFLTISVRNLSDKAFPVTAFYVWDKFTSHPWRRFEIRSGQQMQASEMVFSFKMLCSGHYQNTNYTFPYINRIMKMVVGENWLLYALCGIVFAIVWWALGTVGNSCNHYNVLVIIEIFGQFHVVKLLSEY